MQVLVVMGVAGVGKTTIGLGLADVLGWTFYDADDFHPPANKAKMSSGQPLTDADRWGWLERLQALIAQSVAEGKPVVLACSALRAVYRDLLSRNPDGTERDDVCFVYLKAPFDVVRERIDARAGHYMPPSLLTSQFATLEEPEDAIVVDASHAPEVIVADICDRIAAVRNG